MESSKLRQKTARILVVLTIAASIPGALTIGATAASGSLVPADNATICAAPAAGFGLDVAAAADVPKGDPNGDATLGTAGVNAVISAVGGKMVDPCTAPVPSAYAAELKAIAALYRTNPAKAHSDLIAFIHGSTPIPTGGHGHAVRAHARLVEHSGGTSPCPALAKTIAGPPSDVQRNVDAATTAQNNGDTAGAQSAIDAARSAFSTYVSQSGASTVGDWYSINAEADYLGMTVTYNSSTQSYETNSYGQMLHQSLQDAADKALDAQPDNDTCGMSASELPCYEQTVAMDVAAGGKADGNLSTYFPCGSLWTFAMTFHSDAVPGYNSGFTIQFTSNFNVSKTGTVSVRRSTPNGGRGVVEATSGTCGDQPPFTGRFTVSQTAFTTTVTGKRTATAFSLILHSPGLSFDAHTTSSQRACGIGVSLFGQYADAFHNLPVTVKAAADATRVEYTDTIPGQQGGPAAEEMFRLVKRT